MSQKTLDLDKLVAGSKALIEPADKTPHHWKLRHKLSKRYLNLGDIDPSCQEDRETDPVVFTDEESAHNARLKYEKEFEQYDSDVQIEVVTLNSTNQELSCE